jgi:hypothetical protein
MRAGVLKGCGDVHRDQRLIFNNEDAAALQVWA